MMLYAMGAVAAVLTVWGGAVALPSTGTTRGRTRQDTMNAREFARAFEDWADQQEHEDPTRSAEDLCRELVERTESPLPPALHAYHDSVRRSVNAVLADLDEVLQSTHPWGTRRSEIGRSAEGKALLQRLNRKDVPPSIGYSFTDRSVVPSDAWYELLHQARKNQDGPLTWDTLAGTAPGREFLFEQLLSPAPFRPFVTVHVLRTLHADTRLDGVLAPMMRMYDKERTLFEYLIVEQGAKDGGFYKEKRKRALLGATDAAARALEDAVEASLPEDRDARKPLLAGFKEAMKAKDETTHAVLFDLAESRATIEAIACAVSGVDPWPEHLAGNFSFIWNPREHEPAITTFQNGIPEAALAFLGADGGDLRAFLEAERSGLFGDHAFGARLWKPRNLYVAYQEHFNEARSSNALVGRWRAAFGVPGAAGDQHVIHAMDGLIRTHAETWREGMRAVAREMVGVELAVE